MWRGESVKEEDYKNQSSRLSRENNKKKSTRYKNKKNEPKKHQSNEDK